MDEEQFRQTIRDHLKTLNKKNYYRQGLEEIIKEELDNFEQNTGGILLEPRDIKDLKANGIIINCFGEIVGPLPEEKDPWHLIHVMEHNLHETFEEMLQNGYKEVVNDYIEGCSGFDNWVDKVIIKAIQSWDLKFLEILDRYDVEYEFSEVNCDGVQYYIEDYIFGSRSMEIKKYFIDLKRYKKTKRVFQKICNDFELLKYIIEEKPEINIRDYDLISMIIENYEGEKSLEIIDYLFSQGFNFGFVKFSKEIHEDIIEKFQDYEGFREMITFQTQ